MTILILLLALGLIPQEPPTKEDKVDELSYETFCSWHHLTENDVINLEEKANNDAQEALVLSNYYMLIKEDKAKYFEWLTRSAELGNPIAQASLAYHYFVGEENNREDAFFWAEQSSSKGIGNVFIVYEDVEKEPLPPQYGTSLYWIRLDALRGNLYALKSALQGDDLKLSTQEKPIWLELYQLIDKHGYDMAGQHTKNPKVLALLRQFIEARSQRIEIIKGYSEAYSEYATPHCKKKANIG